MARDSARDEIVGHATLAVLALLGMLLYSTTYALLYATTGASSTPTTATLEMFMVTVHLASACGCCLVQTLVVSLLQLRAPIPYVAQAQTSVLLGVAGAVGALGDSCIRSATGAECAVYFGAAAIPRLAAAGAITWSLVVYSASLGAQPWTGGAISLGVHGREGLAAAAVMGLVPWSIQRALVGVCGDAWRLQLCTGVSVVTDANVTTSTVQADCGNLDTGLLLATGLGLLSLVLSWIPGSRRLGNVPALVGAAVGTLSPVVAWSTQPGDVRTPVPGAFFVICACFAGSSLISLGWAALMRAAAARRRRRGARGGYSSVVATNAPFLFQPSPPPTTAFLRAPAATLVLGGDRRGALVRRGANNNNNAATTTPTNNNNESSVRHYSWLFCFLLFCGSAKNGAREGRPCARRGRGAVIRGGGGRIRARGHHGVRRRRRAGAHAGGGVVVIGVVIVARRHVPGGAGRSSGKTLLRLGVRRRRTLEPGLVGELVVRARLVRIPGR